VVRKRIKKWAAKIILTIPKSVFYPTYCLYRAKKHNGISKNNDFSRICRWVKISYTLYMGDFRLESLEEAEGNFRVKLSKTQA